MARGVLWLCVSVVAVVVAWVSVVVQASATQGAISVDTGGYKGVVVAISDSLSQDNCSHYINNIKAIFQDASSLMYNATGERVFFSDVTIAMPTSWECLGESITTDTIDHNWQTAHVRVGPSHALFTDTPWTQQPGGCGDPGDFIYLSHNFVLTDNITTDRKGKTLVHEWAKFRWGAFEEYGHVGDSTYPTVYRSDAIFRPNYCTDVDIPGSCSCSDDCSVEGEEEDCTFTPDLSAVDNTTIISSSLLAAPFIDTVVTFCDQSTHNNATTTKHNVLCDQRSTWEVISQHSDLQGSSGVDMVGVTFKTVRAIAPRTTTVFLVEYTDVMGSVGSRWEYLRDFLLQYILTEAPTTSRAGVVIFDQEVRNVSVLYDLAYTDKREALAAYIPHAKPTASGTKNIETAIQAGVQVLGETSGSMVLLTANLEAYDATGQDLVGAASGSPVWPILYPSDPDVTTQVFQDLANITTTTSLLTVPNKVDTNGKDSYQSTDNYVLLADSLRQATHSAVSLIASETGTTTGGSELMLTLSVENSANYDGGFMIEVLYTTLGQMVVDVNGPTKATNTSTQATSVIYTFSNIQDGDYVVTAYTDSSDLPVVARAGGVAKTADLVVDMWAPRGLENLQFEPGVAPRFFATVETSDGRRVVNANVKAELRRFDGDENVTVVMRDGGVAGDVTGSDGVYTGVVAAFEPGVTVEVSVTANDNNGSARAVGQPLRAPVFPEFGQACCGSQLDLSGLQQDEISSFSVSSSPSIRGRLTGDSPGDFPPGRVTDLRSRISGWAVTLTFTAPGARLDQEKASHYEAVFRTPGEASSQRNIPAQDVGTEVSATMDLPDCDKVYTITVVAVDNSSLSGKDSNPVQEIVSCSYTPPQTPLSAGEIAGIVIGCILGVLLIILIVYLCLNRDHLDDLWVWKVLTCRYCCKTKKDDDRLYNPPPPKSSRRVDVIRKENTRLTSSVQPIRSVSDLYAKPDLKAKHTAHLKKEEQRQQQAEESDDGGFGEHQRRNVFPLRPVAAQTNLNQRSSDGGVSSRSSLNSSSTLATQPINQVGLSTSQNYNHGYQPNMARDNHGYDKTGDAYNTKGYNYPNRPPVVPPRMRQAPIPPRPPRHNTQV